jgi:hypothetical protein
MLRARCSQAGTRTRPGGSATFCPPPAPARLSCGAKMTERPLAGIRICNPCTPSADSSMQIQNRASPGRLAKEALSTPDAPVSQAAICPVTLRRAQPQSGARRAMIQGEGSSSSPSSRKRSLFLCHHEAIPGRIRSSSRCGSASSSPRATEPNTMNSPGVTCAAGRV